MSNPIEQFWQAYLATLPPDDSTRQAGYIAESFGDNPGLADELAALIVTGAKTATCFCLWEWEAEGELLPEPGLKTVVLNGQGEPACIIETTAVTVRPFNDVNAAFGANGHLATVHGAIESGWRAADEVLAR